MLCEARGQESYILVTVVVVFVVVVATILSAICVVTNTSLPQYVRVILLSYCLANATGRLHVQKLYCGMGTRAETIIRGEENFSREKRGLLRDFFRKNPSLAFYQLHQAFTYRKAY